MLPPRVQMLEPLPFEVETERNYLGKVPLREEAEGGPALGSFGGQPVRTRSGCGQTRPPSPVSEREQTGVKFPREDALGKRNSSSSEARVREAVRAHTFSEAHFTEDEPPALDLGLVSPASPGPRPRAPAELQVQPRQETLPSARNPAIQCAP